MLLMAKCDPSILNEESKKKLLIWASNVRENTMKVESSKKSFFESILALFKEYRKLTILL